MRKYLKLIFNKLKRCPKCASKNLDKGYWSRGWNNMLNQATGDNGVRCYDCFHIEWDQTLEEYKRRLPSWCTENKEGEIT